MRPAPAAPVAPVDAPETAAEVGVLAHSAGALVAEAELDAADPDGSGRPTG